MMAAAPLGDSNLPRGNINGPKGDPTYGSLASGFSCSSGLHWGPVGPGKWRAGFGESTVPTAAAFHMSGQSSASDVGSDVAVSDLPEALEGFYIGSDDGQSDIAPVFNDASTLTRPLQSLLGSMGDGSVFSLGPGLYDYVTSNPHLKLGEFAKYILQNPPLSAMLVQKRVHGPEALPMRPCPVERTRGRGRGRRALLRHS